MLRRAPTSERRNTFLGSSEVRYAMNIQKMKERLDQMMWLPADWDGFGTVTITQKVYGLGKQLLDFVEPNTNITDIRVMVGVDPPESLFVTVNLGSRLIEMTITNDGMVLYDEFIGSIGVGSGSFYISKQMVESILS
jgi:hypothetical protein